MTGPRDGRRRRTLELLLRLDPRSREPLQQQIRAGIRRAVLEGVLRPGMRVPSSRALAVDLGVSRTTTLLATEQLVAEGYLTTARGSGTFVAQELPDDMPRAETPDRPQELRHPPLSRRGAALIGTRPAAHRVGGPPRPFRLGIPALDLFPVRVWSQMAARRLASASASQLDYGEPSGLLALREAIADHVRAARGTRCSAEQVVVTAGAQRAMHLVCQLLLDPGDEAWMEEPGYPGAYNALAAAGARIRQAPVDADGLDVAALARRRGRARLAYVTPSHQFPLGVPMSLPRRLALLQWASASGAWVIEDDYDSEFRLGSRPIPCLHGLDVDGRVIYVSSFSKTLFPALRLGFLIVPDDLRGPLLAARRAAEMHPPRFEQAVLADFMLSGHYERHVRRMRATYRERLEALVAAARRHCAGALRLRPTRTGLHAVADLAGADAEAVFQQAAQRRVEVMPLSAYCYGRWRAPNALVLGFGGVRPDASEAGMERLASAIDAARRVSSTGAARHPRPARAEPKGTPSGARDW